MQWKTGRWVMLVVFVAAFLARSAHAYIDPGTGSCVLQTTLGILFALGYTTKVYWRQIRAWFHRSPPARDGDKKSEA